MGPGAPNCREEGILLELKRKGTNDLGVRRALAQLRHIQGAGDMLLCRCERSVTRRDGGSSKLKLSQKKVEGFGVAVDPLQVTTKPTLCAADPGRSCA